MLAKKEAHSNGVFAIMSHNSWFMEALQFKFWC